MKLIVKWIGIGRIIDMNKLTEVLILNKKLKLEELNFLQIKNKDGQVWNEYPYSDEQENLNRSAYRYYLYYQPAVVSCLLLFSHLYL